MTNNEKKLIESFHNLETTICKAQEYIKENYNVESEYDNEDDMLYIWANNINESLNLAAAKEYIGENIGYEMINVIYGKKQ